MSYPVRNRMAITFRRKVLFACALTMSVSCSAVDAQTQATASGSQFGLAQNRDTLHIEGILAQSDLDHGIERYGGNTLGVRFKLGEATAKSRSLTVYYERDAAAGGSTPTDAARAHIHKLDASVDFVFAYQNCSFAGDNAVFDLREGSVTMNWRRHDYKREQQ
jgi:hypothetical protein